MPGIFTGNTSVNWSVEVDNAREGSTRINPRSSSNGRGLWLAGTEENNGSQFMITIRHPQRDAEREVFIAQLETQLIEARKGAKHTTLTFAVEDIQHGYKPLEDQITIRWDDKVGS